MIDIIIWSWQDMCKKQGKRSRNRNKRRNRNRSNNRSRFWLNEMSYHLAVLKPRLMIDIIIWSWQDMCREQGKRSRKRNKRMSRSKNRSRSKSRSRFRINEMSDHLAVLKPRLMNAIIIWFWQDMCKEQGARSRNRSRSIPIMAPEYPPPIGHSFIWLVFVEFDPPHNRMCHCTTQSEKMGNIVCRWPWLKMFLLNLWRCRSRCRFCYILGSLG